MSHIISPKPAHLKKKLLPEVWKISLSRKLKNSPLILTVAFIPPQSWRVPVPAEQTYSCSPALSVHTVPSAGIPQSPGQREQEISIVLQSI